jgi:hypothetical protein
MYTSGSIILIDSLAGEDGADPLIRVTPEVAFPETEAYPETAFATPWPITEDLYLAAYSPKYRADTNSYSIYLVDTLGGRELVYRDPGMSAFTPIPIRSRERPPVLASQLNPQSDQDSGVFYVQNVYESDVDLPPGSVKRLRLVRIHQQPTQRVPDRSKVLFELPKEIIGTVPVARDGSVVFEAPAGVPLLFQLLDENDLCLMSMRSFVYLHPGERQSCVGCHEPRESAPGDRPMAALMDAPVEKPVRPDWADKEGGLAFARIVQPVLDRNCISCHGLDEELAGGLNLLGTIDASPLQLGRVRASESYNQLTGRPGLVAMAIRNQETPRSRPKDYFSHAGRLAAMLLHGDDHHEPLDRESLAKITAWLDLNAQFYGDYSWNKLEWRQVDPNGERALREHVSRVLGADTARRPFAALVNIANPSESWLLKAPLATDAGGWGLVEPCWASPAEAGFREMERRVLSAIVPLAQHDMAGTCSQEPCQCEACWVPEAEEQYRAEVTTRR